MQLDVKKLLQQATRHHLARARDLARGVRRMVPVVQALMAAGLMDQDRLDHWADDPEWLHLHCKAADLPKFRRALRVPLKPAGYDPQVVNARRRLVQVALRPVGLNITIWYEKQLPKGGPCRIRTVRNVSRKQAVVCEVANT